MSNIAKISKILGIDFGAAKVGLALADSETKIAFAYGTIKNDKNFLEKLVEIIEKEEIGAAVIGRPEVSGFRNRADQSGTYQGLADKISEKFPQILVEFQNEMFTTKSAQRNLIEKGERSVGKVDDAESARIILQEWLDKSC